MRMPQKARPAADSLVAGYATTRTGSLPQGPHRAGLALSSAVHECRCLPTRPPKPVFQHSSQTRCVTTNHDRLPKSLLSGLLTKEVS